MHVLCSFHLDVTMAGSFFVSIAGLIHFYLEKGTKSVRYSGAEVYDLIFCLGMRETWRYL